MSLPPTRLRLHRYAVFTAILALLPIVVGALVTTKGAGMAFRDWPTSDGQGMFAYGWLASTGDKFLEHGHRLAGMLIGFASIGLVGIAIAARAAGGEKRGSVLLMSVLVLAGVIAQGLLGGARVLMDQRGIAFIHGSFAALVFSLMVSLAVVTAEGWDSARRQRPVGPMLVMLPRVTAVVVFLQYILGGMVRHRGMHLNEHLIFAMLASVLVLASAVLALRSAQPWLRAPAIGLCLLLMAQLMLGLATWVTKLGQGAGPWVGWMGLENYTPVAGSALQTTMRTGHVLGGMLLLATVVVLALRAGRLGNADNFVNAPSSPHLAGGPA